VAAGFAVETVCAGSMPAHAAAVVVASHGRGEEEILADALQAGVPYVGLVASRRRGAAVVEALGDEGRRIHTPAGLDIGGHAPGEVAVSILAEIITSRPAPAAPVTEAGAPAGDAVDPVCGMTVATATTSLHADHDGVTYWFCGHGCRAAFLDDPARYLH
jgi:xanthine dehydrogenase accessory factor